MQRLCNENWLQNNSVYFKVHTTDISKKCGLRYAESDIIVEGVVRTLQCPLCCLIYPEFADDMTGRKNSREHGPAQFSVNKRFTIVVYKCLSGCLNWNLLKG